MRPYFVPLFLVACQSVPNKPAKAVANTTMFGCRQSPDPVSGVRYACSNYQLADSTGNTNLRAVMRDFVAAAEASGFAPRSQSTKVDGADDAILIEYHSNGKEAFDVIATKPVDALVRVVQCRVQFENLQNRKAQEATCKRTIATLLEQPAPPPQSYPEACFRARDRIATLPGHPDEGEIHHAQQGMLAGCTEKLAACVLASASYVEATLCTD